MYNDTTTQADAGIAAAKQGKWGICGIGLMDWDKKMYDILKSQVYTHDTLLYENSPNELHTPLLLQECVP
jgi:hypothetical protein